MVSLHVVLASSPLQAVLAWSCSHWRSHLSKLDHFGLVVVAMMEDLGFYCLKLLRHVVITFMLLCDPYLYVLVWILVLCLGRWSSALVHESFVCSLLFMLWFWSLGRAFYGVVLFLSSEIHAALLHGSEKNSTNFLC